MSSIKVKFRPSTVDGKEGGLYFQIIHNRVIRQLNTDYKVFAEEWIRPSRMPFQGKLVVTFVGASLCFLHIRRRQSHVG